MTLPIDSSLLPADVRAGGPKERKLYEAALGFERLLTNELTKSLASATGVDGSDDDSDDGGDGTTDASSAATSTMRAQLPDQLASAVEQGGGLGLAPALYRSMTAKAAAR
jgi:Rod binding domain-containing protein